MVVCMDEVELEALGRLDSAACSNLKARGGLVLKERWKSGQEVDSSVS